MEQIPKGLSEDVVRIISKKKNEPDWLLEFRIKAYRHWQTMKMPEWANLIIPKINYQDIIFYSAPKQKAKYESIRHCHEWLDQIQAKIINRVKDTIDKDMETIENKFNYECDANYIELTTEQENCIRTYLLQLLKGNVKTMTCLIDMLKSIFAGNLLRFILFFSGTGRNGKSLLLKLLQNILKKAMDIISKDVILQKKSNSSINSEMEKLDKCRLGYVTDYKKKII
jgi:hypothetical protein